MTVEKPKPKQLLRPITTGANSAMNQLQFLAITCNSLKEQEKSRVHGAIGFGFVSHWLKNWRESFKPITKRNNRNHVITFDSHLKTALYVNVHKHCDLTKYAQIQQLLLFQSPGNLWNRLRFANKCLILFEEINEKFRENYMQISDCRSTTCAEAIFRVKSTWLWVPSILKTVSGCRVCI